MLQEMVWITYRGLADALLLAACCIAILVFQRLDQVGGGIIKLTEASSFRSVGERERERERERETSEAGAVQLASPALGA
mmetsp:Transcript_1245/g.1403  ORF Transcript_1245/g.1403 Transcript_1245/m.1403 type:complete len:80 (-) Transcript_1245:541-780(-)